MEMIDLETPRRLPSPTFKATTKPEDQLQREDRENHMFSRNLRAK